MKWKRKKNKTRLYNGEKQAAILKSTVNIEEGDKKHQKTFFKLSVRDENGHWSKIQVKGKDFSSLDKAKSHAESLLFKNGANGKKPPFLSRFI